MFCVNCGKPYEASHKFCNYCGSAVPPTGGQGEGTGRPNPPVSGNSIPDDAPPEATNFQESVVMPGPGDGESHLHPPSSHATLECPKCGLISPEGATACDCGFSFSSTTLEQEATVALPLESAPYAIFVSLVLGSAFFISVVVFNTADALARNRWDATVSTLVASAATLLLARSAPGTWRRVVVLEPTTDAMLLRRRRVLRNTAIIILFFLATAAIVGAEIGQNRAEAAQLMADLARMNTLSDRISKARNAVEATIPSYVQMYNAIESDVEELQPTLERLKTELALYDGKFPSQREQTSKSIAGMDTGIKRMALLKQQIEVSKQIAPLDPAQQFVAWKEQMQPLLESEDLLNKAK